PTTHDHNSDPTRRSSDLTMQDGTKAQEVFNEATSKALETMTFWAEANQRVMHELVELSAGTAKESIRLYAELQQGAIDAIREGRSEEHTSELQSRVDLVC